MKKTTNKQRCKNCAHKCVCPYQSHYENLEGVEKCKHYWSKQKAHESKKRQYFRKCGVCGQRHEQSEMIRTYQSPNGWICFDCNNAEHPEYEISDF